MAQLPYHSQSHKDKTVKHPVSDVCSTKDMSEQWGDFSEHLVNLCSISSMLLSRHCNLPSKSDSTGDMNMLNAVAAQPVAKE